MRARSNQTGRKAERSILSVRLNEHVTLEAQGDGRLAAIVEGYPVDLGRLSAEATRRAAALRTGLPLASFAAARGAAGKEMATLARRLARRGLVEYRLAHGRKDLTVIEPQVADYWPRPAKLRANDTIVLSRFAYLRRRGNALVLESPRAAALFQICEPTVARFLAELSRPQKIAELKRQRGLPGLELFALLADCQILLTLDAGAGDGLRPQEGDHDLVLWDFHDLVFHTRSTEGRQANPLGGLYPYAGLIAPLPAERPSWPGNRIALGELKPPAQSPIAMAQLLRKRHSVRDFDEANPVQLAELAQFLDATARVLSRWENPLDFEAGGPVLGFTSRPYPSAGSAYELELYLAVANCAGLSRGFYHYDASAHALVEIEVGAAELQAMLGTAQFAMGAAGLPQVLITIAARFGRLSWKYSAIAYSLILKNVGALLQTFYLTATDMGLGGCAIGTSNIELFAKTTGLPFHAEGPVGQFALGRGAATHAAD